MKPNLEVCKKCPLFKGSHFVCMDKPVFYCHSNYPNNQPMCVMLDGKYSDMPDDCVMKDEHEDGR